MAWIKDKLMNRKIEGESSFDGLEPLAEKLSIDDDSQDFVLEGGLCAFEFRSLPIDGKQVIIGGGSISLWDSDSYHNIYNDDDSVVIDGDTKILGNLSLPDYAGSDNQVLGLDIDGNVVPVSIDGGTKLYEHFLYLKINDVNYYFRITSNREEAYTSVDQLRIDFSNGRIVNILRNYTSNKMSNCLVMLDIQTNPLVITWTFVSFSGTSSSNIDGITGTITELGTDTINEL